MVISDYIDFVDLLESEIDKTFNNKRANYDDDVAVFKDFILTDLLPLIEVYDEEEVAKVSKLIDYKLKQVGVI